MTNLPDDYPQAKEVAPTWPILMNPCPQGWQCPKCQKIYGPQVAECAQCNEWKYLPQSSSVCTAPEMGPHWGLP